MKMLSIAKCYKVIDHFESEGKSGIVLEFWRKKLFKLRINWKKIPLLINIFQIEIVILLAA